VLDERARQADRERLAEVRAELEEAERNHDPGRADRLQAELAALEMELGAAVGLGRRPRRIRSDLERRRVAATKRTRATIAKIAAVCPALGEHHPSVTARLVAAARRNLGRRGSDRTSGPASVTRRVLLDAQFMSMLAQLVVLRAAEDHLLERDALRRDEMDRVAASQARRT
jgi:hypothetical protein